ncbi:MAG: DNA internalization-related competence protein ComEC/Rec2 [Gammaproteobacteria bacterium]|jgi:competence protein ComEC|nr:DNA internalization-related competence protein ComEC/Rec2 [Gammaproteobacteria bacterium]MBQ0773697.1 DNA internalization-related competence protein ComEC/Rec2 [Gammaproteobacteria bacterium]
MLRIGMFFCSAGIITGVFFAELTPRVASLALIAVPLLALILLGIYRRLLGQVRWRLWALPTVSCCVCAAFLSGQLYGQWRTRIALAERLPVNVTQAPVQVVGEITGLVEQYAIAGHGDAAPVLAYQFDLHTQLPSRGPHKAESDWLADKFLRVQAYSDVPLSFDVGDQIDAMMTLAPVRGLVNGVGPDNERSALARGVDGYASVEEWREIVPARCCALTRWREQLAKLLSERLQQGSAAYALIPALVAGDRRKLEADHWRVLQRTGVAHLISISGLHISLVCGAIWWFSTKLLALPLGLIRARLCASQMAVFPALFVAVGYAAMAGFSLPTSRALLMTFLVMVAHLLRLRIDPSTVLVAVLFVLLMVSPLEVLSGGFWLSFLAVGLLMVLLSGGVRELLRAQLLLSLGSGAFAGWLFSAWSLVSILANLIMVPLFSFVIIPLALLGTFLATLFDKVGGGLGERIADALLSACAALIDGVWPLLNALAKAPSIEAPASLFAMLALLLVIIRFTLPFLPGPRWLYLFLLLPWIWPQQTQSLTRGQFELVVFDVGQGQMTAVRTANQVLLYDAGPQWRQGSAVASILRPWLVRESVSPMLAFISHGDTDHSGGYADMRSLWPHMPVFSGDTERVAAALPCLRGQAWRVDGVQVDVLWPAAQVPLQRSNNRSCVVKITSGDGLSSALLSGDIELPVEFWLAQHGTELRSDVLQVPHHGSQTSSSYGFIRAVQPRWATVSSGYRNRFHHPALTTQQRYQQFSVPMLNTSDTGLQRFVFAGGLVSVAEFARDSSSWPWRVGMPVIE